MKLLNFILLVLLGCVLFIESCVEAINPSERENIQKLSKLSLQDNKSGPSSHKNSQGFKDSSSSSQNKNKMNSNQPRGVTKSSASKKENIKMQNLINQIIKQNYQRPTPHAAYLQKKSY